jgi:3-hydroxy-3-methylglutaryl CoA synthase
MKMLNAALALCAFCLVLPFAQAHVSAYNHCLDEAFQGYDKSVTLAGVKRERQKRMCYHLPYGEKHGLCLEGVEKTYRGEKLASKVLLNEKKKLCFDFL